MPFVKPKETVYYRNGSSGKKMLNKANLLICLIFLSLIQSLYASNDQLCDLMGTKNIINNDTIIECIDFEALQNDTVTVYGDVSSISKNGLALCPLIDIEVENPDIVYVLDQSWSMPAKSMVIYDDTEDTIISNIGASALNKPVIDSVLSPWEFDFLKLPRLINATKNSNGTRANWAGDPYGLSAVALHKALDYQSARSKTSTAGFCGLHKMAAHPFSPKPLNNSNLQEIKDSIFINDYVGKTYFYPSLAQAKEWLLDTSICKNERQMIIFISDGCPTNSTNGSNDKWDYLELLNENNNNYPGIMPPIYSVFLGFEGTINYKPLQDLSDTTGGSFYIVPPDDPDSLVGVLKALIEKSFETPPLNISLTNTTIFPNQTSKVDENSVVQQADGSWQMILDSSLGLLPGINNIEVEIKKSTWEGASDTSYYSFYINVAEQNEDSDSSFEEVCYDKVSIKVKNSEGNYTTVLTEQDTVCELYFNVYKHTPLTYFPIKMISTQHHDTEFVSMHINYTSDENSDTSRLSLLNEFLFLSNDTLIPTPKNNRIETCASDTIILSWQNPRNREDFLLDTIFVDGEKILFNPINAALFDTSENGAADLLKITFDKRIPKAFLLDHAYWNKKDTEFDFTSTELISVDSNVITYRFKDEYKPDLTSIPSSLSDNEIPIVIFKEETKYSLGVETIAISDSVMVSPVKADVCFSDVSSPQEPDTLIIEVSEFLKDINLSDKTLDFLRVTFDIFYDSLNPTFGYENSSVLKLGKCIQVDTINENLLLTFLLDAKSEFLNRDVILYLNRDAGINDLAGNISSRKGIRISFHSQLYYTLLSNKDSIINNYEWPTDSVVYVNLFGLSKTDTIDTFELILSTSDNDTEMIILNETDNNTGIYIGQFNSVYINGVNKSNDLIEGIYDNKFEPDTTLITGSVKLPLENIKEELIFIYKEKPPVDPTVLYVKNSTNQIINKLSDSDSLINILLDIYRDNFSDTSFVTIYTSRFHDSESVMLTLADSVVNDDTIKIILSKPLDFISCDTIAPITFNNRLETSANDSIYLKWTSRDNSDEAFDTVAVIGTPIIFSPVYAAAFDKNNNGQVDFIKVKFDKLIPKLFELKSASWPSENIYNTKLSGVDCSKSDSIIEFNFINNEFEINKTFSNLNNPPLVIFKEETFYNLGKIKIPIDDSVGVVPVSALLLKSAHKSKISDTLIIKVSEAISINSIIPSPIRINDSIIYAPNAPSIGYSESRTLIIEPESEIEISNGSDENIVKILLSKENSILKGSTIYLNDSSSLYDNSLNHSEQKGIPLNVYGKLFFTKEGIEDSVINTFISPFDSVLVAVLDVESITETIDTLHLSITTSGGDKEILIMKEEAPLSGIFKAIVPIYFNNTIEEFDGVINGKYLNENHIFIDTIFGTVNNGIQETIKKVLFEYRPSPQIITAIYSFSDLNSPAPDTLRLTFNTPVSIDLDQTLSSLNVYDYWSGLDNFSDKSTSIMLEENSIQVDSLRAVILIQRYDALIPMLDSIRFTANCLNVTTSGGVNPNFSTYCPITISKAPPVDIAVVPNPLSYSEGQIEVIPPINFNGLTINGALFLISSRLLIERADVVIFDVVGNILFKSEAKYDNNHHYLYSIWNGKNTKNRVCGPGTYIANIKVIDVNDNTVSEKLYIGIKNLNAEKIELF